MDIQGRAREGMKNLRKSEVAGVSLVPVAFSAGFFFCSWPEKKREKAVGEETSTSRQEREGEDS